MIRTYYIELQGNTSAYGESWVELEEVLDSDGNVDEKATLEAAKKLALQDADEGRIDWEADYNVDDVEVLTCHRDD